MPTLRDHLFPLILFLSVSVIQINEKSIKNIILIFIITIFIMNVFGVLQFFFFNEPISQMMGRIDFIDSAGYIQYKTSSARIMGIERMAGISGGPNGFGLLNGFYIVFLYGVSIMKDKFKISTWLLKFMQFNFILSLLCLILSFSRAGWAITIVGIFVLLLFENYKTKLKYFIVTLCVLTVSIVALNRYFPFATKIIENSFNGQEDSFADRGNNVSNAFNVIIKEPIGHGLGTTDNRNDNLQFFAESAFMNIAFEIGIFGILLLIFIHLTVIKEIYINFHQSHLNKIIFAIAIPTLLVCFISINPYGMPYIYLWWFVLGLGINTSKLFENNLIVDSEIN